MWTIYVHRLPSYGKDGRADAGGGADGDGVAGDDNNDGGGAEAWVVYLAPRLMVWVCGNGAIRN